MVGWLLCIPGQPATRSRAPVSSHVISRKKQQEPTGISLKFGLQFDEHVKTRRGNPSSQLPSKTLGCPQIPAKSSIFGGINGTPHKTLNKLIKKSQGTEWGGRLPKFREGPLQSASAGLVPALQLLGQGQQGLHVPTAAAHQHRQAAARRPDVDPSHFLGCPQIPR